MILGSDFGLHRLGWKAFQDLCIAVAEERLQRPVQTFLPTNDAGRDGAFLEPDSVEAGESTIQCKFTSKPDVLYLFLTCRMNCPRSLASRLWALSRITSYSRMTLSRDKVSSPFVLLSKALAWDVAGSFIEIGLSRASMSWPTSMMVPRLYGLANLTELLDTRAYQQAQLILSEMEIICRNLS